MRIFASGMSNRGFEIDAIESDVQMLDMDIRMLSTRA